MLLHIIRTCDTPDSRAEGLQHTEITKDECCLFIFDASAQHGFWGLNTPQLIWVNFVDGDMVKEAKPIHPHNMSPVKSIGKYKVAFEALDSYIGKRVSIGDDYITIG